MVQITLDAALFEHAARVVHPVERLVKPKSEIRRVFQREFLADDPAYLPTIGGKQSDGFCPRLTAKRENICGGELEIGGGANFADGDREPVEIRIMHVATRQDFRQSAPNRLTNPQLPLGRARAIVKLAFCHGPGLRLCRGFAKREMLGYGGTRATHGRDRMADLPGIVVTGASGRMGQTLIRAVIESDKARLVGAIERDGHDWIGRDIGEIINSSRFGVTVESDPLEAFARAHAVIDFTTPEATLSFAALAAQARLVHVIGTTGMTEDQIRALEPASRHAVIVRAGNMSLGVNLIAQLVRKVAGVLDDDYDIEVIEAHHNKKIDAPSGTALMLGEAAAAGRGVSLNDVADRGRDGITGPRKRGHIGFSAIRGGDIVGEHDVMFAAPGERIILRHVATDREIYARGAIKAALWGQDRKPGCYDMIDVLGL